MPKNELTFGVINRFGGIKYPGNRSIFTKQIISFLLCFFFSSLAFDIGLECWEKNCKTLNRNGIVPKKSIVSDK